MRQPDILSALTLNVVLALFSMIMAIFALGLLAFVLAKENQTEKADTARFHPRDKIRRHESTIVDFSKPNTVPDHFLQLNTLMFQKKNKNNQIKQVAAPIPIEGLDSMMTPMEEDQFRSRALPPLPGTISTNELDTSLEHRRARRSSSYSDEEQITTTTTMAAFVTDSGSEGEADSMTTESTEASGSISGYSTGDSDLTTVATETTTTPEDWIVEKSTIEPQATKIILDLECGSEVSLC